MKVKVLYFGSLKEKTRGASEWVEADSLDALKVLLRNKYEFLGRMNCIWAVNQEIQNGNAELKENDEIAVMPPFAGG